MMREVRGNGRVGSTGNPHGRNARRRGQVLEEPGLEDNAVELMNCVLPAPCLRESLELEELEKTGFPPPRE